MIRNEHPSDARSTINLDNEESLLWPFNLYITHAFAASSHQRNTVQLQMKLLLGVLCSRGAFRIINIPLRRRVLVQREAALQDIRRRPRRAERPDTGNSKCVVFSLLCGCWNREIVIYGR